MRRVGAEERQQKKERQRKGDDRMEQPVATEKGNDEPKMGRN